MITYDLPAQIDYVLSKTGQRRLQYVGWSQGTTIMFGLLAEKPQYNEKIQLFHAMAPAVLFGHMKSTIRLFMLFLKRVLGVAEYLLKGSMLGREDKLFHAVKRVSCRSNFSRPVVFRFFLLNQWRPSSRT
uniref:Putative triglyceride lipase-cholesterol esterase n=1 Tax=Amblyomma triste TaxID=251400 RepID=A0A023G455_AMBTT